MRFSVVSPVALPLILLTTVSPIASASNKTSACGCGYRDSTSDQLYTDSIIVYFNETSAVDHRIFQILDYDHKKEKGWSSIYRQGAKPSNVGFGDDSINSNETSLELWVNPATPDHLVNGAQLKSVRQDILYGTFRASMRSAQPWIGGSTLGMTLEFNSSKNLEMDLMNMNNASDAFVANVINGEWPTYGVGINYTVLEKGNQTLAPLLPWDFMDVRFDWHNASVDFWVGENRTRSVTKKDRSLPDVPQPLSFRHWSTGDINTMGGPPVNRSVANVRYVRAFFNSSLMTAEQHDQFDLRCSAIAACSVDDYTLRGSTAYSEAASISWEEPALDSHIRKAAGIVAGVFSTFGIAAIINAFIRRTPWNKLKKLGIVNKGEKAPGNKEGDMYDNRLRRASRSLGSKIKTTIENTKQIARRKSESVAMHHSASNENLMNAYGGPSSASGSTVVSRRNSLSDLKTSPSKKEKMTPRGLTPAPSYKSLRSNAGSVRSGFEHRITPLPSYHSLRDARARDAGYETDGSAPASPPIPRSHPALVGWEQSIPPTDPKRYSPQNYSPYKHLSASGSDASWPLKSSSGSLERRRLARNSYLDHVASNPFDDENCAPDEIPNFSKKIQADGDYFRKSHYSKPTVTISDREIAQNEVGAQSPAISALTPGVQEAMSTSIAPVPKIAPKTAAPPAKRIDYLAGFVALSCIGVTFRHFSLTFWPFVTEGSGNTKHFKADTWMALILGPYILTPLWIGPFFVTSCRFLSARYLKNGKLSDIAQKVLLRGPRMLIPCFIFMALEYFLISLGLTSSLEWLPSISYSVWPFVTPQPNFGVFLNEIVELAYLIPNAAPEVINHYCVGVLWTIPVQHFYSYVTLLAAVMVRDIKKPWKRFTFYFLAIGFGWYASSWSACHWMGLMLTDMDLTYDWIKWTQARPKVKYPLLIFCLLVALASPLVLLFNSEVFYYSFMSYENAIHADIHTGKTLLDTSGLVYPDYYAPSLALLLFSTSLQIIVEMSKTVQWIFSLKVFTILHPYIMTIYLMHGFVFWSVGAWLAVVLGSSGIPYWAVLTIVGLVCYAVIFFGAVLISPLIEFVTQATMKNIWRWATEDPVPHRETVAPYSKGLVLDRNGGDKDAKAEA